MASDAPRVFISYNQADRTWAEWIAWILEEAGFSATIQAWDIRPGHNFVLEMQKASARADHTVIVLSPSFLAADYPATAFTRDPKGEHRGLIPVRVEQCELDGLIAAIVDVDLLGLGEDAAARVLIEARLAVADVAGRAGALAVDLEQLPPVAGAELLRRLETAALEKALS